MGRLTAHKIQIAVHTKSVALLTQVNEIGEGLKWLAFSVRIVHLEVSYRW